MFQWKLCFGQFCHLLQSIVRWSTSPILICSHFRMIWRMIGIIIWFSIPTDTIETIILMKNYAVSNLMKFDNQRHKLYNTKNYFSAYIVVLNLLLCLIFVSYCIVTLLLLTGISKVGTLRTVMTTLFVITNYIDFCSALNVCSCHTWYSTSFSW